MQLGDAIRYRLHSIMKQKNYNYWELYKKSGVPKSTISCICSSKIVNLPRMSTLLHLCEGLGMTIREFFDDDIFNDVEDSTEDKD